MTFYQKVKAALKEHGGPITYPRLAEEMGADEEAVRLTLVELKRRGKAKASGGKVLAELEEWRPS